jgi:ABC-2 type transport system ATP-binding protein
MKKEMLFLKDVCLHFGSSFSLDHLTFQVEAGEIFGFLGPSGAGKTTTMKLLTKQLKKESGTIRIFGRDIGEITRDDYDRIGILSDTNGLYERMTIEDNLYFFGQLRGVPAGRVRELLDQMHLTEKRKTPVKKCSKGMRQRTVLAAAVLHKPELLFLDEPTSGLDPATVLEVHTMLRELNRHGTTIFLTTHNMEEADKLCGRIGILNQGKIVAGGEPGELKLRYAKNEVELLLEDNRCLRVKKDAEGAEVVREKMAAGQLLTIHSKEPNLEEIFIELTGREF